MSSRKHRKSFEANENKRGKEAVIWRQQAKIKGVISCAHLTGEFIVVNRKMEDNPCNSFVLSSWAYWSHKRTQPIDCAMLRRPSRILSIPLDEYDQETSFYLHLYHHGKKEIISCYNTLKSTCLVCTWRSKFLFILLLLSSAVIRRNQQWAPFLFIRLRTMSFTTKRHVVYKGVDDIYAFLLVIPVCVNQDSPNR